MSGRIGYGLAALAVFVTEVLIALFVHDRLIRPHVGDVLAVILVYLTLRAILPWKVVPALIATLAFAVVLEVGQLLDIIGLMGLRGQPLARIVLGGSFDVVDLACYAIGGGLILIAEIVRKQRLI